MKKQERRRGSEVFDTTNITVDLDAIFSPPSRKRKISSEPKRKGKRRKLNNDVNNNDDTEDDDGHKLSKTNYDAKKNSHTRPSRFSACNIEKLGWAWDEANYVQTYLIAARVFLEPSWRSYFLPQTRLKLTSG